MSNAKLDIQRERVERELKAARYALQNSKTRAEAVRMSEYMKQLTDELHAIAKARK